MNVFYMSRMENISSMKNIRDNRNLCLFRITLHCNILQFIAIYHIMKFIKLLRKVYYEK